MNGRVIQELAAARAEALPGSALVHPFGEDWDVWKVRGKVFLLQTVLAAEPITTLKATPADAIALREEFNSVTPGYHMNKRHWITLNGSKEAGTNPFDPQLVEDLVTESYLLVVAGLPKRKQPVDPRAFEG